MADLEQKRRTVRVLELLSESFEAHRRGDDEAFRRALDEAMELDVAAYDGIWGGIMIGEIPNPERDWPAWTDYVAANREALAAAETEARRDDFTADRHADLTAGEYGMMADADYYDRIFGAGNGDVSPDAGDSGDLPPR